MANGSLETDLTVPEILGCYDLDKKHIATLEVASLTDTPEALEHMQPEIQEACRALRKEANAEAEFNDRFNLEE